MGASFRAELLVLRKWPAVWVLALLPPSLVLLFDYFLSYFEYQTEGGIAVSLLPEQVLATVAAGSPLYGGTAAIVLGALVAGGEQGRGTLKTSLTQRPTRFATYAGQALALLAVLAASVLITLVVGAVCSLLISIVEGESSSWPSAMAFAHGIGVVLFVYATYAASGLALGILFRSAGLAIAAGLVWAFVIQISVETVAAGSIGVMGGIYEALPGTNAVALVSTVGGDSLGAPAASPDIAPWVLAAYTIAFLALGAILLLRRDVA